MAGVMDTIKGKLGLGPEVKPKDAVNSAANVLGGQTGKAVATLRGRQAQIDAQLDTAMGMPPPKGQK